MKKDIPIIVLLVLIALAPIFTVLSTDNILEENITNTVEKNIVYEYEIPIDSFALIKGKIKRNQTLSLLLSKYNVPENSIYEISKRSKGIFNFRKIRAGNKYTLFCSKDSTNKPAYFVYECSTKDYVVVEFSDSLKVEKKEKQITIISKESTGIINSSLWNAIVDNDLHPALAMELSEIYAWNIDFFDLKKGDNFLVMYDEHFVDSVSIGIGNIYTVCFKHQKNDFFAFRFEQDSIFSYFDEDGNSLKRAFLKSPLRYSRISSGYSRSRFHPILKIRRPHRGVDYAAPTGTPVFSVGDGVVIKRGYTKGAGNYVKVKHNSVYTTGYNHFSRFAKGIKQGKKVKQGDVIGYVGQTGYATGPHLDFRFWKNGKLTNPLKIKAPPVEPIKEGNIAAFDSIKNYYLFELNKITEVVEEKFAENIEKL